ncbi:hypothetical protein JAK25_05800 [Stenotrophomonas maltophilia]|uniref:hypothetical protein n=1 Tax=Stenotrophomonas maltophilia TaxID=40324 RepID=UPI0021C632E3|nr:hypothetical protein [Stenotrophomonas maltophilia]MCU1203391.1 hypothetical protein [Stenotrophomonas maltophilia]
MKGWVGAARARLTGWMQPLDPVFLLTALLVPMIAVRAYLVLTHGSSSPFWDQWDAEFDNLLLPYLRGELDIGHFFAAHNEHRILFTRLISLGLFALNGNQFDAKVEMLFNVLPHAAAIGAMAWAGMRTLPAAARPLLALGTFALAASPLGWENLIAGFQNQFFILALLSVVTAWLASADVLGRTRIIVMVACAGLALFTMASGVFAAAAAAGLLIYRLLSGDVDRRQGGLALGLLMIVAMAGLLMMPQAPHGDTFHAHSAAQFMQALKNTLAWPLRPLWISVVVLWLPTAALSVLMLRRIFNRSSVLRGERFAFAIAGWVLVQAVAMAYSRGIEVEHAVSSRYTDLLTIGVINNLWLVLYASFRGASRWPAWVRGTVPAVFIGWTALSMQPSLVMAQASMEERSAAGARQERLLSDYLRDGDLEALRAAPGRFPYPDSERIATVLAADDAADMMPLEIRRPLPFSVEACSGISSFGAYTTLPVLPYAVGTYAPGTGDANQADCRSAAVSTDGGWIAYRHAGAGMPAVAARLEGSHHSVDLVREGVQGERWRTRVAQLPADDYRLHLVDNDTHTWIAVTPPSRIGGLSALRLWAEERAGRLLYAALVLVLMLLTYAAAQPRISTPRTPA